MQTLREHFRRIISSCNHQSVRIKHIKPLVCYPKQKIWNLGIKMKAFFFQLNELTLLDCSRISFEWRRFFITRLFSHNCSHPNAAAVFPGKLPLGHKDHSHARLDASGNETGKDARCLSSKASSLPSKTPPLPPTPPCTVQPPRLERPPPRPKPPPLGCSQHATHPPFTAQTSGENIQAMPHTLPYSGL